MNIHYPKGIKPISTGEPLAKAKSKIARVKVASGNRGMAFEKAINESNQYYLEKGLCLITKRPTPIKILKTDFKAGAKITSAVFEKQSTTDYNGVYQGHYIDFEAKSTRNKTAFPLANIPLQQIEHLERVKAHQGIAFFLIEFVQLNEVYLLPADYVCSFWREKPRKSIPLSEIKENGYLVKEGYLPRYDYLPLMVDAFLKKEQ